MTKMLIDRSIVEQVLETLERYQVKRQDFDRFADEITALCTALKEQPVEQEQRDARYALAMLVDPEKLEPWQLELYDKAMTAPQPTKREPLTHDEDLLERLYWEFDSLRKRSADERIVFKGKMRFYAAHGIGE